MGYFEQALEMSAALGGEVDEALKPARAYLQRADGLNKQLAAAREREEASYAQRVEAAVTTGKLPSPNGFGQWIYDSPASKLTVAAVAACHIKASSAAREAGPAIFAALQRRVAGLVTESVKVAKSLPATVNDQRSAMRAGEQHSKSWVRLGELLAVWEACHELNRTMQLAGWIDGPGHANDRTGARTFQAYEKPPPLVVIPRGPRERHLAAAVAAGAMPALIDWPTAASRWQRVDRRQRPYVHAQVTQRHDSWGHVLAEEKGPETPSEFLPVPQAG